MSLIRVCAITTDCYPEDPLVRRTAEAAASASFEYHVICSMGDGQGEYELFNGVHVHRIRITGKKGKPLGRISARPLVEMLLLWSFFGLLAFGKVARLHWKLKFDVVQVHNLPDFLVFSALIPKAFGARVILEVQDVAPELMAAKAKGIARRIIFTLAKWQERLSTAFADHVLTVGWPFEEPLLKRGVPREKLSSVLNSADPNIFPKEKRTEPFLGEATADRPIILMYHGTCSERNGLDVAIHAFAKARTAAPYLRLHINGGGDAIPNLKKLAQTLDVADHVLFFPHRPLEKLVDFVVQGDIGIIPYRSDGFMDLVLPTKAYEFAWMHRPMIASDTLAIRSMFRPGSVRLCEPSNIDSFAEAIVDLYRHPQKRAQLVANAEQDYAEYRWEVMAERYRQLLTSLAQTKPQQTKLKRSLEVSN
jgi:glycosyltransferase involved in cell wall biosynthesis